MKIDKPFTILKRIVTPLVVLVAFACGGDDDAKDLDTTAPEITISGDNPQTIVQPNTYEELGATALDDTDGEITDRIEITSNVNVTIAGSYEVTYSVSDAAENTTSSTRDVIVVEPDTTAPEITIIGDTPLTITLPAEYTELGATALDDIDGDISDAIVITTTADFFAPGNYEVTYSVSDAAGNATSSIREVIILEDQDIPEITIIGDNPLTITRPNTYVDPGATALDDTDGDITHRIEMTSTVNENFPGDYVVTYTVLDTDGNTTSSTRDVIVKANPIYLDFNGITVKAIDGAVAGDVGTINGVEYTVVDIDGLKTMISNGEDVTHVCTTLITNMNDLFRSNSTFNQDIGSWDVSNVTTMERMFNLASDFNQDIGDWDVSNVFNMKFLFADAKVFNQDIGSWNVSNVTLMYQMFYQADDFNKPIGSWDVSSVTGMYQIFGNADNFNQDISGWDVSNVTNMEGMFAHTSFNCGSGSGSDVIGIGAWTISKTVDDDSGEIVPVNMDGMFLNNTAFNNNISGWDVSYVNSMGGMFFEALAFNQDIGDWDVSNVTSMGNMFGMNSTGSDPDFEHDLSGWVLNSNVSCGDGANGAATEFDEDNSSEDWIRPIFSQNSSCYQGN